MGHRFYKDEFENICEICDKSSTGAQHIYYLDDVRVCHECYSVVKRKPRYTKIFKLPFMIEGLRPNELVKAEIRYGEYDKTYNRKTQKRRDAQKKARLALWPNQKLMVYNAPEVVESERFAITKLEKDGYTDLMWTRLFNDKFWCDVLGKDPEGNRCAFDVKLSISCDIPQKKRPIILAMGLKFLVVHVYPAKDYHYVDQVPHHNGSWHSSAYKSYLEFIRKQSKLDTQDTT